MEAKIRNKNLVIVLPLEEPHPSASKKTLVVASSHGVQQSTARVDGKIVSVVANAFIDVDVPAEKKKSEMKRKAIPHARE